MARRIEKPMVVSAYDLASWVLMALALVLVLHWHVLPALLAGLLVYELVHVLAPRFRLVRISLERGKLAAVAILAIGIAALLTLAVLGSIAFFHILLNSGCHLQKCHATQQPRGSRRERNEG